MRALLICPRYADALWTYKHAQRFLGKKASSPPLGLLTIAALLPKEWQVRFIDLNARPLTDADLEWAQLVLVGAMLAQQASALEVIARAHAKGRRILAGGPLFCPELIQQGLFKEVDHIIVGEAEGLIPEFLADLESGTARRIYRQEGYPEIQLVPVPRWELVDLRDYAMTNLQFTRGCPHDCEFCYGHVLNGHRQRFKSAEQITAELDALYSNGWRGSVFVCDDNLSGTVKMVRGHLLPAISQWMRDHGHPFTFTGAASVNLAREPALIDMLVEAGFESVTLGLESTNADSLAEVHKLQNLRVDPLEAVRAIQARGLEVHTGMILGFDHDPPEIFEQHIQFIQRSGISNALVSLLFAFPDTALYDRLKGEGRLVPYEIGTCVHGAINFRPRMPLEQLTAGYRQVLQELYAPDSFYGRMDTFLDNYRPVRRPSNVSFEQLLRAARGIYYAGIRDRWRGRFWRQMLRAVRKGNDALVAYLRQAISAYFVRMDIAEYAPAPALGL